MKLPVPQFNIIHVSFEKFFGDDVFQLFVHLVFCLEIIFYCFLKIFQTQFPDVSQKKRVLSEITVVRIVRGVFPDVDFPGLFVLDFENDVVLQFRHILSSFLK